MSEILKGKECQVNGGSTAITTAILPELELRHKLVEDQ